MIRHRFDGLPQVKKNSRTDGDSTTGNQYGLSKKYPSKGTAIIMGRIAAMTPFPRATG